VQGERLTFRRKGLTKGSWQPKSGGRAGVHSKLKDAGRPKQALKESKNENG